jgi:hypothetical protein
LNYTHNFTDFGGNLTRLDYENSGWVFNVIVGPY